LELVDRQNIDKFVAAVDENGSIAGECEWIARNGDDRPAVRSGELS
jgi:hypothetical protein